MGFSLLEVCLAIFILSIAIIPILDAFSPAIRAGGAEAQITVFANQARKTLNRMIALDFGTLYANRNDPVNLTALLGSESEAAKENFTLDGQSYSPIAAISDASGGSGGLLQLSVTVQCVTLKTLKADY